MRYFYGALPDQFCDLYKPDGIAQPAVVILIHGGYWKDNHSLTSYATYQLIPLLLAKGVAVWNVEYRRMPVEGDNTSALWPAVFSDIGSAVDLLSQVAPIAGLDLNAPVTVGHSAGGTLALWAAYRHNIAPDSPLYKAAPLPIAKTLSIAGVIDLQHSEDLCQPQQIYRLLGGAPSQLAKRYQSSNPNSLYSHKVATYLYHGGADSTVSVEQVKRFVSKHPQVNQVIINDEADHFSMLPQTDSFNVEHWAELDVLLTDMLVRHSA